MRRPPAWLSRRRRKSQPQPAIRVEFSGNRMPGDDQFIAWLKKNIRPHGGGAGVLR